MKTLTAIELVNKSNFDTELFVIDGTKNGAHNMFYYGKIKKVTDKEVLFETNTKTLILKREFIKQIKYI